MLFSMGEASHTGQKKMFYVPSSGWELTFCEYGKVANASYLYGQLRQRKGLQTRLYQQLSLNMRSN